MQGKNNVCSDIVPCAEAAVNLHSYCTFLIEECLCLARGERARESTCIAPKNNINWEHELSNTCAHKWLNRGHEGQLCDCDVLPFQALVNGPTQRLRVNTVEKIGLCNFFEHWCGQKRGRRGGVCRGRTEDDGKDRWEEWRGEVITKKEMRQVQQEERIDEKGRRRWCEIRGDDRSRGISGRIDEFSGVERKVEIYLFIHASCGGIHLLGFPFPPPLCKQV